MKRKTCGQAFLYLLFVLMNLSPFASLPLISTRQKIRLDVGQQWFPVCR
jgi:hypothetical protein